MRKLVRNVQRVLKRIDRSLSGPLVEFSEQFLYGHREILMNYAQLDNKAMIKGSLEHGWALDSGKGIRKFPSGRYLYLSWSEARMMRSMIDDPMTIAIGAPFIYAHAVVRDVLKKSKLENLSAERDTLFFPVHGNEFSQQNAESQVQLFTEHYSPTKATVCLYWVEYVNPQIYGYYESMGFNIVCSGFSGQMEHTGLGYSARRLAGSPIGGRPNFILNTIAMFASYENVVFGGVGSGLFYAAYMEKNITLLHKYLSTSYLDMDYEWGNTFKKNPDEVRYVKYIADSLQCEFADIDYNSQKFREFVALELGVKSMKSPDDLRRLLEPHICHEANPQSLLVYSQSVSQFSELCNKYARSRLS